MQSCATAKRSSSGAWQVCLSACTALAVLSAPVRATPCAFEAQGDGHVTEIIDGRSFRLSDGREIKLAGIEPTARGATKAERAAALAAIVAGKDVALRGADDTPDRYGSQTAFVFLAGSDTPVQIQLLAEGAALVSSEIADKECAAALLMAEGTGKAAKKGIWNSPTVIKNAESTDDILAGIGHFLLVEGRVLSVRQAGATTYLNFGRRWTRDFAVTISRRNMAAVESAGIALKSLENRQIRVRGWVDARPDSRSPGPRMAVVRAGQIEVLGGN
jgi:endonuclease YncB( thermonuclease family)